MPAAPGNLPTPQRLVEELRTQPPVAQVLAQLQLLLSDPNSKLDDVAELVRLDMALTTRVIQISNSAWFHRGLPGSTISEAVNRIGFREIYRLVGVVAASAFVSQSLAAYNRTMQAAWRESMAAAFAAEMLAERVGEDASAAYMCGLMHAIGRLPINQFLLSPDSTTKVLVEGNFPYDHSGAEYALLGFTQADVGSRMLQKWGFAPAVVQPIAFQYAPLKTGEGLNRLAAVLYGARLLRAVCCERFNPATAVINDEILALLRLNLDEVLALQSDLDIQLARAWQLTKIPGKGATPGM